MKLAQLTPEAIADAAALIRPYVRLTPVVQINGEDFGLAPFPLTLKLEQLQHSGSFKARGAFMNALNNVIPAAGIVAASGGNHGAAVAYAAMRLGVRSHIFVPSISSPAKVERIREYGADLVVGGESYADALAASEVFARESGALVIHAFDSELTMLGTGTIALELDQQMSGLDTVVAAVGGGGLLGGIAAWYSSRIAVLGVEPELAPTLTEALVAGRPVDAQTGSIAADSLAPRRIGSVVFPILQRHVRQALLVSDDDIRAAQAALWDRLRLVVEPGGAAAFAALLAHKYVPQAGERVAVVLSGANTTISRA
ncbi:MAG: threonine/serine dehydratase [Vulcanimicrobiaceae bacterium]